MLAGLAYAAHSGSNVLISLVKDALSFSDPEFHKREATLLSSRTATVVDSAPFIAAIGGGELPISGLYSHDGIGKELPEAMPRLIEQADFVLMPLVAV